MSVSTCPLSLSCKNISYSYLFQIKTLSDFEKEKEKKAPLGSLTVLPLNECVWGIVYLEIKVPPPPGTFPLLSNCSFVHLRNLQELFTLHG